MGIRGLRGVGPFFAALVGTAGVLAAVALPFMPVIAQQATVTWPAAGALARSTTAFFVPYRPAELTATLPCAALRPTATAGEVTVLATGASGDALVAQTSADGPRLLLGERIVRLMPADATDGCAITVHAGPHGTTVSGGTGPPIDLPGEPVPKVFALRTDLKPEQAAGITVTARTASAFATRPATVKTVLIAGQLVLALIALGLLTRASGRRPVAASPPPAAIGYCRWRAGVDVAVIAVLACWAVVGPLAVDDGWATMIARTYAASGNAGNYYRWWNAAETPFAFSQQLLAPLTRVSLAPVWLRLPSTVLAVGTWFVLTRGVLAAALPVLACTVRVRVLAAVCLLAAWLPFDLGARPESYVAFGATTVLALLWGARGPAGLGWAALTAGLTLSISPTSVIVAAPVVVLAPRAVRIVTATARGRMERLSWLLLMCGIASVGLTVIFADQTWDGLLTATDWHTFFGPSLPWYHEPDRYHYLLGAGQQGSFAKRLPVAATLAMLPLVIVHYARGRTPVARSAFRLAAVVALGLLLLSVVPSKWSYHLGAMAGLLAALLVMSVVLVFDRAPRRIDRRTAAIGLLGAGLLIAAAALSFAGSNAWWLPAVYDVPWSTSAPRPTGLALDSAVLWAAVLLVVYTATAALAADRGVARLGRAVSLGPAVVTVIALGTGTALLLGSFVAAPLRRPQGSLALANVRWLTGHSTCGLADDIQVLADRDILTPATPGEKSAGFTALGGFSPNSPPPDPPGSGMSTYLWGSRTAGSPVAASITTAWFTLPPLGPAEGLSMSLSGKANTLVFEFGHDNATTRLDGNVDDAVTMGEVATPSPAPPGEDPDHPSWRAVGIDAEQIPVGANRVRIRAIAAGDKGDWLAFTGPRRHTAVGLSEFLAAHGPVLVSWPQSFLFPCVHNISQVADGLAQTPRTVITAPGPWLTEPTDQTLGGDFAGLNPYGRLYEVPTRMASHPGIHWGTLLISGQADARDAYSIRTTSVPRPGHGDRRRLYQTDLP